MKTEIRMMPNGNMEEVPCYVQHDCHGESCEWSCKQYIQDMKNLVLKVYFGDPYEDGFEYETKVRFCPFCGYHIDK